MSYLGVGVSPGNVPVYHSADSRVLDRRVRVAELVLRCVVCALGLVASVLVATDTQVKEIFSIQKKAKFTDMKALVYAPKPFLKIDLCFFIFLLCICVGVLL